MNGNAAAKVNKESFSLKRRKGTKLATVASAQAKLEVLPLPIIAAFATP